jgi:membrane protein implicated in regulation of membrane protease activity
VINGIQWSVRPKDGVSTIPAGTEVIVREISGVKLIVEPVEAEREN